MKKSQHIASILNQKKSPILTLYQKAKSFIEIDQKLKEHLNLGSQDHYWLSDLSDDVATIVVDSSSWATRLRYNIPKILKILNTNLNFNKIKIIRIKIKKN